MDHDGAHKLYYALPETTADLLRIVAADWVDDLDLTTLEKMSAEHVDEELLKRLSDMIWRVRFRCGALADGSRPYVLLMQEFQSTVDRGMAERFREYTRMLHAEQRRNGTAAREGGDAPVLPALVYNGAELWTADGGATSVTRSVPTARAARALTALQPQAYVRLDAGARSAEDLPVGNRVTASVRLQRSASATDLLTRLREELARFPGTGHGALREARYVWAKALWAHLTHGESQLPPLDELDGRLGEEGGKMTLLEARAEEWKAEWFEQGVEQGVEQGLAHERSLIVRMAALRFGRRTAERLSDLLGRLPDSALTRVGESIVTCATGEELLEIVVAASARGS